jgi:hypothetical protein
VIQKEFGRVRERERKREREMLRNHCVWFPQSLSSKGWGAWVGGSGDSEGIWQG